jgi:hypothetical protein
MTNPGLPVLETPGMPARGFSCAGSDTRPFIDRPTVYVGWLDHRNGINMSNDLPDLLGGITNVRPRPLKGLWLGGSVRLRVADRLGCLISGGTLIPQKKAGTIVSNIGLTADFAMDEEDWYLLEGLGTYQVADRFNFLAGFRWDHTSSRLHVTRPGDSFDDFVVNAYLPIVGVEVRQGRPENEAMFRLLGFPAVPGTIVFHNWSVNNTDASTSSQSFVRGYYLEALMQYRRHMHKGCNVGAFARWNFMYSATDAQPALSPDGETIRWLFQRKSWTLGIECSLDFCLL